MKSAHGLDRSVVCLGFLLALVVASALPADARQVAGTWPELTPRLRAGDTLIVKDLQGTVVKGRLAEASPETLVLLRDGRRIDLRADQILEIKRRHYDDPIWTGLLVGLGVGIPFGIAAQSYANNEGGDANIALLFPILVGAGIGSGVDALLPARTRIYRARPPADVRVGPIVHPRAKGIQVRIAF